MRVLVLSDTHAPTRWRGLPRALAGPLREADAILHAGDVCTAEVLDLLASYAPVHVVLGNNDGAAVRAWGATATYDDTLAGVRLGMIHDSGPKAGRAARMRRAFPAADLVVYGHSHIPYDAVEDGLHLLNPGSPTDPRGQPTGTYAVLDLDAGRVVRSRIEPLPRA